MHSLVSFCFLTEPCFTFELNLATLIYNSILMAVNEQKHKLLTNKCRLFLRFLLIIYYPSGC
jgi:hypothetical protein